MFLTPWFNKWPYCKSVKGESLEESWFPSVKIGYEGSIVKALRSCLSSYDGGLRQWLI